MKVRELVHICSCGEIFEPQTLYITEVNTLMIEGVCPKGHNVGVETPLTELYKMAMKLKREKPFVIPKIGLSDAQFLHAIGVAEINFME